MTYANIELKEHDRFGEGVKRQSIIDPFLKDLIEQLALKYPQWTFVESGVTNMAVDKTYLAHRFEVKDKREVLGTIEKDHYNGDYRFAIDNHRIESMRERGSGMKTIHLKKALKHVDKFFGKKSVVEHVADARQKAEYALHHVLNEKDWALQSTWRALESHAKQFLMNNYQQFMDSVVDKSKLAEALEQYPSKIQEHTAVHHIQDMTKQKNTYIVFIDGVNYSIQKGEDPVEIKQSDELPDFMRRAIGLLKLVEDNQVVADVGLRVNASTFLILPNNVS
jgi:hypothetical protein